MEHEDFAIFLGDFCDFLNKLEAAITELKQKIARLVGVEWSVIMAPKPVSPEDRAVKWLEKRLGDVKERHKAVCFELLKDTSGLITGMRFIAEKAEQKADIEALANWAFQKAASKPDLGKGETQK